MSDTKKPEDKKALIAMVIFVALLIAVLVSIKVYHYLKNKKILEQLNKDKQNITGGGAPPPKTPKGNDKFPLVKGSYGDKVKNVQYAVNKLAPASDQLPLSGKFDKATYLNLISYAGTKYYPVTTVLFNELMSKVL